MGTRVLCFNCRSEYLNFKLSQYGYLIKVRKYKKEITEIYKCPCCKMEILFKL